MSEEMIDKTEAKQQVRQMGRMMAGLYHHMCQEIIVAVGEEKAKAIIRRAVWNYGFERGVEQKEKIIQAGYEHIPENYARIPDLPSLGWEVKKEEAGENSTQVKITYCPFAEVWKEKSFADFGRIYCSVDQAKYKGFHCESELLHLKNMLDGDEFCEMVCRQQKHLP